MSQPKNVPTYAANGKRLRNHSEPHVLELERRGVVVLSRAKSGRIKVCQFKTALGANPTRKTAHLGTQYSFLQRLGDARLWQHKQLVAAVDIQALFGDRPEDPEKLDLYMRAIFRAVPLSILARGPEPNVVLKVEDPRPTPKKRIAA